MSNLHGRAGAVSPLKISLPYSTYGLDVVVFIGIQQEREHKQFTEIQALLNGRWVVINAQSVGIIVGGLTKPLFCGILVYRNTICDSQSTFQRTMHEVCL